MNQTNNNLSRRKIVINIQSQTLCFYECSNNAPKLQKQYSISTGENGIGCMEGTGKTPLGKHIIAEKVGENQPINTVFIGRVPTGEIYSEELGRQAPDRDWILSRILWLAGTEDGYNQGENDLGICDTHKRYIYIHGTPDTEPMGIALSHGCIRMRNADVMELFNLVDVDTEVEINV